MEVQLPLMKQVLNQAPRIQIDDSLALLIEIDKKEKPWSYDLSLEWVVGSKWDVFEQVSEQALHEWTVKLAQGLNRTLGEGIPCLAVPALRP